MSEMVTRHGFVAGAAALAPALRALSMGRQTWRRGSAYPRRSTMYVTYTVSNDIKKLQLN